MIAQLSGDVLQVAGNFVVLNCHGLGFKVFSNPQTLSEIRTGQHVTLATSLVVREDALTLYGFADVADRDLFELAQTAQGVGPKVALAITSVFTAAEFAAAVRGERAAAITKVPGIGTKGAQKLILELKDKVAGLGVVAQLPDVAPNDVENDVLESQVIAGLEGLGWSTKDAKSAWAKVQPLVVADPEISISQLIRAALRSLAKA